MIPLYFLLLSVLMMAEAENPLSADGLPSRNQDWSNGQVREIITEIVSNRVIPVDAQSNSRGAQNTSSQRVACFPSVTATPRGSVLTQTPWADSANTYARIVEENGRWTDPAKIRLSHDNTGD